MNADFITILFFLLKLIAAIWAIGMAITIFGKLLDAADNVGNELRHFNNWLKENIWPPT